MNDSEPSRGLDVRSQNVLFLARRLIPHVLRDRSKRKLASRHGGSGESMTKVLHCLKSRARSHVFLCAHILAHMFVGLYVGES